MSRLPSLPPLDPAAQAHARRCADMLADAVRQAGGWLPFDRWMQQALYAPGLGYYAAGSAKFALEGRAPEGDFVTAPELSPLFALTLARTLAPVLRTHPRPQVLELGAGSGALAAGLLAGLEAQGIVADYLILEVSADLRARQQARLAAHGSRVRWLDALPASFEGCVVANEVLDAMPVQVFRWDGDALLERGVALAPAGFRWEDRPAAPPLAEAVRARMPALPGYVSEINLQAEAFVRGMGTWLARGLALFIDYGFTRAEYYHPQRAEGTLMCHLRHVAHADPFHAPGMQDITAHVDFTAMADAALDGGLDVLGYASQASFLADAGLVDMLAALDPADVRAYAQAVGPVQKLLSPAEMGELFKVLAIGREVEPPVAGFARGDRRHML